MRDDAFGGAVAERLGERELRPEAAVFDFGTGGLDLAYEVMRGYDGLILVDVSRQGGEPGTLYVMSPDEESSRRRDRGRPGPEPARHGPADGAALRATLGAWPGKVVVIACEPEVVEEMGLGLSDQVAGAVERGRRRSSSRRSTSSAPTPPTRRTDRMHELSLSGAVVNTAVKHARAAA